MVGSYQVPDNEEDRIVDIYPFAYFLMKKLAAENKTGALELMERIENAKTDCLGDEIKIGKYHFEVNFSDGIGECAANYENGNWSISEGLIVIRDCPQTVAANFHERLQAEQIPFKDIIDFSGYDGGYVTHSDKGDDMFIFRYKNEQSENVEWGNIRDEIRGLADFPFENGESSLQKSS